MIAGAVGEGGQGTSQEGRSKGAGRSGGSDHQPRFRGYATIDKWVWIRPILCLWNSTDILIGSVDRLHQWMASLLYAIYLDAFSLQTTDYVTGYDWVLLIRFCHYRRTCILLHIMFRRFSHRFLLNWIVILLPWTRRPLLDSLILYARVSQWKPQGAVVWNRRRR